MNLYDCANGFLMISCHCGFHAHTTQMFSRYHVGFSQRTEKKCTKVWIARAELLFCPLDLLFCHILAAVVVVICLRFPIITKKNLFEMRLKLADVGIKYNVEHTRHLIFIVLLFFSLTAYHLYPYEHLGTQSALDRSVSQSTRRF